MDITTKIDSFLNEAIDPNQKLVKKIHDNQKTGGTLVRRTNR